MLLFHARCHVHARFKFNPPRIYRQRPAAVRGDVRCHRALQRNASEHARLERGLERGAIALPRARGVGRGGGDGHVAHLSVVLHHPAVELRAFLVPALRLGIAPDNFALRARRAVNRLAHVERLRESRPVEPRKTVANLEARVLNRARHAVISPSPAKCH